MEAGNPYCRVLGIDVPDLGQVRTRRAANVYSLLIVALLERGDAMRLDDVARRFEEAGVAPAEQALRSLKRCRPARPPVYRDGDLYALDPHDREADLWAFRLELRPPKVRPSEPMRPREPDALPSAGEPVTTALLEEAWTSSGIPWSWSELRVAVCVLDAHGRAMRPAEVVAFTARFGDGAFLPVDAARRWNRASAVQVRADGTWDLVPGHPSVRSAREAVLKRVAMVRRWAELRPDPEEVAARHEHWEEERRARIRRLAALSRVIVRTFPAKTPQAVVLLDAGRRRLETYLREDVEQARAEILRYDVVAGIDVRATLRALGIASGERVLHELGPPQKTIRLDSRGRTLKITVEMLIRGSCGISRPLGAAPVLRRYLDRGQDTRLRRRLESDAKSLLSLYRYGLLHGAVRLRWGFLDERLPVPWCHWDEIALPVLQREAAKLGVPLEVVVGSAPGWSEPWSRARLAWVRSGSLPFSSIVVDDDGIEIGPAEIQLARLAGRDRRFRVLQGAGEPPPR